MKIKNSKGIIYFVMKYPENALACAVGFKIYEIIAIIYLYPINYYSTNWNNEIK